MRLIKRYLTIWWLMSRNTFVSVLYSKLAITIFLTGKVLRFAFFFAFIFYLVDGSQSLAGYNVNQVIFFYLTFNLVDVISQFLFREVYRFRPLIISGSFDLVLVKPVNALFRSLFGGADLIDLLTIPPLIFLVIHYGTLLQPSLINVLVYVVLIINGLIISAAFYIVVLALAIITLEIDHTAMIYRDIASLGRFPVDIYKEPIRGIITFLVPVAIMITIPAKMLMNKGSLGWVFISLAIGAGSFFLALKFWNYAIKKYSSASS